MHTLGGERGEEARKHEGGKVHITFFCQAILYVIVFGMWADLPQFSPSTFTVTEAKVVKEEVLHSNNRTDQRT